MTKFYKICMLFLSAAALASCVELDDDYHRRPSVDGKAQPQSAEPAQQQSAKPKDPFEYVPPQPSELAYYQAPGYDYYPECGQETTVVVYDDAGSYQVPGCIMDSAEQPEEDEEINPDDIEGEFPYVKDNKYHKNQVVMQNLQTRVLAYCRGDEEAVDNCIKRLECAGYTQLRNVPTMPAKYDLLRKGSYPTRRWREGETVPRW